MNVSSSGQVPWLTLPLHHGLLPRCGFASRTMLQSAPDWLFHTSPLTPHGFCMLWEPWLIWSFVTGDALTALAYFVIPLALTRFVQKRPDTSFRPVFWLFALFILLCGTTHWLELLTIWVPAYGLEAVSKLATAAASIATAVAVWKLLPQALALPTPAQMRGANMALTASEAQLRLLNVSLEARVGERTAELTASEAQLRDLLATLDIGTFMTRDLDGTIRFWSDGCARLYGWSAEQAVGRNAKELLQTVFPCSSTEIDAALAQHGGWAGNLQQRARDGRELIVSARKALRRDAAGQPVAVLEALTDVTEAQRLEREWHRTYGLLGGIVATAPGLIYAKDRQGCMLLANPRVMSLVGKPWSKIQGLTDREILDDPAQAELVMANDRKVMEVGITDEFEEVISSGQGAPRVWLSTKTPLRGPDGKVDGVVGVSVEITERKRAEERLVLMVHELNHRVKNTLATVQSIALQTLRGADPAVRLVLDGRLQALAAAHDVLTQERWQGAELNDIITVALAPFGGRDSDRFKIYGPIIRLSARAALALSMGLHELGTNALKYGCLSVQSIDVQAGDHIAPHVELRWSRVGERLQLDWRELGGPPVTPPARRGFGTRLVGRSLAQDLDGTVKLVFAPEGLVCTIDAALAEIGTAGEVAPLLRAGALRS